MCVHVLTGYVGLSHKPGPTLSCDKGVPIHNMEDAQKPGSLSVWEKL